MKYSINLKKNVLIFLSMQLFLVKGALSDSYQPDINGKKYDCNPAGVLVFERLEKNNELQGENLEYGSQEPVNEGLGYDDAYLEKLRRGLEVGYHE